MSDSEDVVEIHISNPGLTSARVVHADANRISETAMHVWAKMEPRKSYGESTLTGKFPGIHKALLELKACDIVKVHNNEWQLNEHHREFRSRCQLWDALQDKEAHVTYTNIYLYVDKRPHWIRTPFKMLEDMFLVGLVKTVVNTMPIPGGGNYKETRIIMV